MGSESTFAARPDLQERANQVSNGIKRERTAARKRLMALPTIQSRLELAKLLIDPPDWILGKRIGPVLRWARSMGEERSWWLLKQAQVYNGERRVGQLTERQRLTLADLLGLTIPRHIEPDDMA